MHPNWYSIVFGLIGGIGILLYGIQVMSDGLQKILCRQMHHLLESVTRNPLLGMVAGIAITVLFQSSTATSVILVDLASAAVITLKQCMPVILGADIGTTVTAQLIALKFTELSLFIVGIGAPIVRDIGFTIMEQLAKGKICLASAKATDKRGTDEDAVVAGKTGASKTPAL